MNEPETAEQWALRAELLKEYGEHTLQCAAGLASVANCLVVLASGALDAAEREECWKRASYHLSSLLALLTDVKQAEQITACTKRIDQAVDLWAMDEVEKEHGLPPFPTVR